MPENLRDVCRLCLSKERLMLPIFQKRSSKMETAFRSKIMSCASIEVFADDDLPSKVCYICFHQIEKFFQFQAMCKNSDAVLHSQTKEILTEPKTTLATDNLEMKNKISEKEFGSEDEKSVNMMVHYQPKECFLEEKTMFEVFSCFMCSSAFLTNDQLCDHLTKNHSDAESLYCKGCHISFFNVNQFKSHLNLKHSLACDYCDCVFKYQNSLKEHLKIHSTENLVCKYCNKIFGDIFELKKHEITHSERTCVYCSKEFDSRELYQIHLKECAQKYSCKFCDQSLQSKKDLIDHVNICHDDYSFQKCSNCHETFTKLKEHKCVNYIEFELECKGCQAVFTDEPSLSAHMSAEHGSDGLSCKICTKKFSLKSSLKRHEKSHSGIKPYQCKFCPRKFKDSSACIVHTRTHTGERPFQCPECNKDFKQLANLKMHTYRHHKKNQNGSEESARVKSQANHYYDDMFTGHVTESYSDHSTTGYQHLNESISNTFNQSMNILISDNCSNINCKTVHSGNTVRWGNQ